VGRQEQARHVVGPWSRQERHVVGPWSRQERHVVGPWSRQERAGRQEQAQAVDARHVPQAAHPEVSRCLLSNARNCTSRPLSALSTLALAFESS
jgi:hypothetical protein